jgi:hypothetical protein
MLTLSMDCFWDLQNIIVSTLTDLNVVISVIHEGLVTNSTNMAI